MNLVCTECKSVLKIDDGFSGGVCRCSSCGTLLKVPRDRQAEKAANSGQVGGRPTAPSPHFNRPRPTPQPGNVAGGSRSGSQETISGSGMPMSQATPLSQADHQLGSGVLPGGLNLQHTLIGAAVALSTVAVLMIMFVMFTGGRGGATPAVAKNAILCWHDACAGWQRRQRFRNCAECSGYSRSDPRRADIAFRRLTNQCLPGVRISI